MYITVLSTLYHNINVFNQHDITILIPILYFPGLRKKREN